MTDDPEPVPATCPKCEEPLSADNDLVVCEECGEMGCEACVFEGVCDDCDDPHDPDDGGDP